MLVASCEVCLNVWAEEQPPRGIGNNVRRDAEVRRTIFDRARSFVLATWVAAAAMLALMALPAASYAQDERGIEDEGEVYAITDFGVRKAAADIDLGAEARAEFHREFDKANVNSKPAKVLTSDDTVARFVQELNLALPIESAADIQRLGQALVPQAAYIVTGTVPNWRIDTSKGGKTATVVMGVTVWDVAAGMKVNGAAVQGTSGVRPADTANSALLQEAIKRAAFNAVQEINKRILPRASVLSTLNEDAYVNQGFRSGFQPGQRVIIRRRKEQVAEGEVKSVDPESCFVRITRSIKGVRPGDKVTAIFVPPVPTGSIGNSDTSAPATRRKSGTGSLNGLFQVILVVGLLGLLLGQGRGSNNDLVNNVTAEADLDNVGNPRVKISWVPDTFLRGNNESAPVQWQVWRNTESTGPIVSVLDPNRRSAVDDAALSDYIDTHTVRTTDNSSPTSGKCPAYDGGGTKPTTFITPGVPYRYEVEVVYKINGLSLPVGTNGFCFFISPRTASSGQATPLIRPTLQNPDDNVTVATATSFKFTSVRGGNTSVPLKYVLQVSSSPIFAPAQTKTFDQDGVGTDQYAVFDAATAAGQSLATPPVPFQSSFPGVKTLYWRIGVRNVADNPGPVPDQLSGKRYIFSDARTIKTA